MDIAEKSLINRINSVNYSVKLINKAVSFNQIKEKISRLLQKVSISRTRRNKTYDLRPLIIDLEKVHSDTLKPVLNMILCAKPGNTGRPDEVLDELGIKLIDSQIIRTAINIVE